MDRRLAACAAGLAVVAAGLVVGLRPDPPVRTVVAASQVPAPLPAAVTPVLAPLPAPLPAAAPAPGDVLDGPRPGPQPEQVPARTAAPADRWALLAGVTDYRAPTHDTIGGANDVRLIRDSLLAAGWLPDHVRVLSDGAATGAGVRDGLAWLAGHGGQGTFSLFHWSGHVHQLGGTTEALWPVDRDFVRDSEVAAALAGVTGRLWVDVAGCEADSFSPGLPADRVLFSGSSKQTEKSYEYPDWQRSVWTGLVFGLGIGQRQADADGDGRVTVGEALRFATYEAQKITRDQRPYGRQTPQVSGDPVRGWTLDAPPA